MNNIIIFFLASFSLWLLIVFSLDGSIWLAFGFKVLIVEVLCGLAASVIVGSIFTILFPNKKYTTEKVVYFFLGIGMTVFLAIVFGIIFEMIALPLGIYV